MGSQLRVPLRYLAMLSTSPEDNVEANIAPVDEIVAIDPAEAALVLVDTWNKHHVRSHLDRSSEIMRARIAPLILALRDAGVPPIYAPSPEVAVRYEQWRRAFGSDTRPAAPAAPAWPPPELRTRSGPYARFARRPGEMPADYRGPLPEWWHWDGIADSIAPRDEDAVVATGEELHRVLAERRRAVLFYAGFATNICVLHRDYGMLAMAARGYLPILVRDCTTAIETRDTIADFATTRLAIQDVERRFFTVDSADLIAASRVLRDTDGGDR